MWFGSVNCLIYKVLKKMIKKIFKYTIRIVLGLLTLVWGFATWAVLTPMEECPCEGEQDAMYAIIYALIATISLITFVFAWYRTRNW